MFDRDGIKAGTLTGTQATEAAVRHWSPGRRVLHLACHGVVDDAVGNVFGALALTPGPAAATDPSDDGFLTMTELSELDLRACELTILSACRTNSGPNRRGRRLGAVARLPGGGFAAGGREQLAGGRRGGRRPGELLLRRAGRPRRRASRSTMPRRSRRPSGGCGSKRSGESPYYWASMVLVGPP